VGGTQPITNRRFATSPVVAAMMDSLVFRFLAGPNCFPAQLTKLFLEDRTTYIGPRFADIPI